MKFKRNLNYEILASIILLMIAGLFLSGIAFIKLSEYLLIRLREENANMPLNISVVFNAHITLLFYFIIAYSLTFVGFGYYILSKKIIKPIRYLLSATERLAKGEGYYKIEQIDNIDNNEIGLLTSSFNSMAEKLYEKEKALKEYIHLLEERNKELQDAKNEIIQSEKLASLGRLAAGIAHEIGNPIGAINQYIYILKHELNDNSREFFERIERELDRISKIVKDMLSLASPIKEMEEYYDINEIIKETVAILKERNALHHIMLKMELSEDIPDTKIIKSRLEHTLINLILNAVDAMPDGGDIKITTRIMDKEYIQIAVEDTGCGISKGDLPHVFDPFFTTKDPGKGTGLGLSLCHRMIEEIGGTITLDSIPNKGTIFIIKLPFKDTNKIKIKDKGNTLH